MLLTAMLTSWKMRRQQQQQQQQQEGAKGNYLMIHGTHTKGEPANKLG